PSLWLEPGPAGRPQQAPFSALPKMSHTGFRRRTPEGHPRKTVALVRVECPAGSKCRYVVQPGNTTHATRREWEPQGALRIVVGPQRRNHLAESMAYTNG